MCARFYLFLIIITEQCTRNFFNTTHQVKAIAIGIIETNPLAKSVIAPLLFTLHILAHTFLHSTHKELDPHTSFITIVFSIFNENINDLLKCIFHDRQVGFHPTRIKFLSLSFKLQQLQIIPKKKRKMLAINHLLSYFCCKNTDWTQFDFKTSYSQLYGTVSHDQIH